MKRSRNESFIGLKRNKKLCFLSVATLIASAFLLNINADASNSSAETLTPQENISSDNALNAKLFSRALTEDLEGRPEFARVIYEKLANSSYQSISAVPSAINFVALDQFDNALKSFLALENSPNPVEASYAHVWQLWLKARTWKGTSAALQAQLVQDVKAKAWFSPVDKALAELYAGRSSVNAVYQAVVTTPGQTNEQLQDALTTATFFTGGWLSYVKKQPNETVKLFEQYKNVLNARSLERPLIIREYAALKSQSNK